jgi:hypothetical protein
MQVNDRAKVSVKLVAEAGIGVVASGVAKANADIIQVSAAAVCCEHDLLVWLMCCPEGHRRTARAHHSGVRHCGGLQ